MGKNARAVERDFMKWNEQQKKIVGAILGIASDKRHRVLLDDENEWLEKKMKEIRRLSRKLPHIKWDGKKV